MRLFMGSKIDKSLLEVFEMKEKNQEDFEKSGYFSYLEYLENETIKNGVEIEYFCKEPTQYYKTKK